MCNQTGLNPLDADDICMYEFFSLSYIPTLECVFVCGGSNSREAVSVNSGRISNSSKFCEV